MPIAGCVMQWVPLCQEAQETKSFHGGIANIIVNTQFNKGIEPNLAYFIFQSQIRTFITNDKKSCVPPSNIPGIREIEESLNRNMNMNLTWK